MIEIWGFREDINMMMTTTMKMRRSKRTMTTTRRTRRTTRRRQMIKLSSVVAFWNHKIENWGFWADLSHAIQNCMADGNSYIPQL